MPDTAPQQTRAQIIAVAQEYIQTVGYNGFSFRDLAEQMGLKSASIHYHFPGKSDLGLAVIAHAEATELEMIATLESAYPNVAARYRALIEGILHEAQGNCRRVCVFGSLLGDYAALPPPMQESLARIEQNIQALHARWLDQGRKAGELYFPGEPAAVAMMLLCTFQGILVQHRARPNVDPSQAMHQLLRFMGATV